MQRVTGREIGRQLGLSQVAVSLALRNHPSLPVRTRERVQALAAQLGYRPDPALGALNAYRQAQRGRVTFQATVGCINRTALGSGHQVFEEFYQGAWERSLQLGFHFEEFTVSNAEQWQALPRILKSRGIEGLLILPSISDDSQSFPWDDFFAVFIGELIGPARLHLVINNQYQSAALAVRELRTLGYKNIGLVMPAQFARRTDYQFMGGYLAECERSKIPNHLLIGDSGDGVESRKKIMLWIKGNRIEVVVAPGDGDILPALQSVNMRVPQDMAVAFLSRMAHLPDYSCVDQNHHQVGVEAANQLSDLLRRNERGIPRFPTRLLVEGIWRAGASTPPRPGLSAGKKRT